MKKHLSMFLVLMSAGACLAEDPAPEAVAEPGEKKPVPGLAFGVVGPVDASFAAGIERWVEENTAMQLENVGVIEADMSSFDAVAEAAGKKMPEAGVGMVVLMEGPEELTAHGVHNQQAKVVVINVRVFRDADETKFIWRVERQAMRGVGYLMGLDLSPNPQSVMSPYATLEDLDRIGRNFDPPWLVNLQNRAREIGIPLDEESGFFMLR